MGEKIRNLMRTPWQNALDRDFAWCECPELRGACSLTHVTRVDHPVFYTYSDGLPVTVIDSGCYWLQFAPAGEKYWLTALFDECGNFDHAYFDMTEYNVVCGRDSYFSDLYLDIAIKKNGDVFVLDEDELSEALDEGAISKELFDGAYITAERVKALYSGAKTADMIKLCEKYFSLLCPKLEDRRVFDMKLLPEPFYAVKSGKKTVELRLFDEKRRDISVGDIIDFSCESESLRVKVVDLYKEDGFVSLFEKYPMTDMGFSPETSPQSAAEQMRIYYAEEREHKYGALGIKIKTI